MKKHTFIRKLYLLLAVIMLFSTVQFPVANALDPIPETVSQETPTEESILTKEELPAYIDYSGAVAAKHVERLESEEELDTLVFRNQDGTYTTYLFDLPIKYVAENGSVQEKDISLVQSSTAYEVASNDIDVMLPFDVSEGIQVSYGTQNVTLLPVQNSTVPQQGITAQNTNVNILESSAVTVTANTAALNAAENTVTYAQAFDNSINIVYTPLLNGVKEDIVLSSYTGIHTFQFLIETDGMGVYYDEEQELYYINSSETAEGGFNIGRVYIYDQNQRVDIGSMTVTTVEENQTYLLTITANENFLTDEETVYPVTIDPTLTFRQESQIRDAIVYSNYPNGAYGGYQYAYVGKYSNYGTGRLLVGFGDLSSFLSRISSALDIQSANLYLYCGTSSAASTLDVYYNDNLWTESSVKYSSIDWSKVSKSSRSTNIPTAAGWYSIDIKTIVQDWKYNSSTPTKGIVIQNSDEATASKVKCFRTKEYAAAHNGVSMPYLAVTYDGNFPAAHPDDGVYMIKNKNSGKYLDVDYGGTANETNVSQHAYNGADNQKWYLEFQNDGLYAIYPLHAPTKALNVYNAGSANNTNVQIYSFYENDSASLWTIRYDAEGHYYFVPFCARDSLLAVQNSSTENSANVVIQNADYDADNQRWYLERCVVEEAVYRIKTSSTNATYNNKFLTGTELFSITINNELPFTEIAVREQIWSIVPRGDDYYTIHSGAIRTSNYTDDMVLSVSYNDSTQKYDTIRLIEYNGDDKVLWKITRISDGTYTIQNKYTSEYLSANGTTVNTVESNPLKWILMEGTDLPDCTWDGGYTHQTGTVKHLKVLISNTDSPLVEGKITVDMIQQAVNAWKNISDNIMLYGPNDTAPDNATYIWIVGKNMTSNLYGETRGQRVGEDCDINDDWDFCEIILNMSPTGALMLGSNDDAFSTLVHELGHALKLRHPFEAGYNNIQGLTVLSTMGYGQFNNDPYGCTLYPSGHDKYMLRKKWGG